VSKEECFQGILNADDKFAARCYLLNYGVGNSGVDQIFLLLKNSLDHFPKPFCYFEYINPGRRSEHSLSPGRSKALF
jgi:hypothetical protein